MMGDVDVVRNGLRIPELAWRMLERRAQAGGKAESRTQHWDTLPSRAWHSQHPS